MSELDPIKNAFQDLKDAIGKVAVAQQEMIARMEALIAAGATREEIQAIADNIKGSTQTLLDMAAKDQAEGQPIPPAA